MNKMRFYPFWKVTNLGCGHDLYSKGCDEYHNKTISIIIPLVGQIIYWLTTNEGEEHLWGRFGGVWEGKDDPDCDICKAIKEEVDAD